MNLFKTLSANWQLWLVILLLVGTIVIIVLINTLSKKNKLTNNTTPTAINPVNNPLAKDCASTRVTCNPKDTQSCINSCLGPEEYKCVNLDSITPTPEGKAINGGGYVCLPAYPTITCHPENGGVYVWTGYGFTNEQTWDCYCMYPEFFGGPGCSEPNLDICSGGTIDTTKLDGSEPTSNMCICPPDTKLLIRGGIGTPYCESTNQSKGGGVYGLVGDLHSSPDWRNILYRRLIATPGGTVPENSQQWATDIVKELTASYDPKNPTTQNMIAAIKALLDKVDCSNCAPNDPCNDYCVNNNLANIYEELANNICNQICPNSCTGVCNCSDQTRTAEWSDQTSTAGNKMWYTYNPNDLPPENYCTAPPTQYYCSNSCIGNPVCPAGITCYTDKNICNKTCPKS